MKYTLPTKKTNTQFNNLSYLLMLVFTSLLTNTVFAQINYSGILNTSIITTPGTTTNFAIDFDSALGDDVNFTSTSTEVVPNSLYLDFLNVQGQNGGEVVANTGPDALANLVLIDVASSWSGANESMNSLGTGNWTNGTQAYLGVRFSNGADTHYGWIQISFTTALDFTIIDYAYEMTPGVGIMAGSTTPLGVGQEFSSNVRAFAFNQEITIQNLPEDANYSLFTSLGQEVKNGEAERNFHKFETSDLSKGLYVLKVKGKESGKSLTRKIIL